MGLRVYMIILQILYACSFMESGMSTDITDRIYHQMLWYEHHQGNYQSSLQHGIIPYCLQLKKHTQIETILGDFPAKWPNILYNAEWKLINLLLDETEVMHKMIENDFDEVLRTSYLHNFTDMKNEIQCSKLQCSKFSNVTDKTKQRKKQE